MSFWSRIHELLPVATRPTGEEGIVSGAAMHRLLEVERGRAERTGLEFSLLTFHVPAGEEGRRLVPRLAAELFNRVRVADTVGWLDQGRIGVLLPETPPPGAHRLGDETVRRMAALGWPVRYQVCLFSTHCRPWNRGQRPGEDDGGSGHRQDGRPADGLRPLAVPDAGHSCPEDDEPMEPLFAVRVPLWKRTMDVAGAAAGLIVLAPLMLLVALAIKLASPGPVFFRQERVTVAGRIFTFLKFRSMRSDNDASGHRNYVAGLIHSDRPMRKIEDDPRILPLGRLLRKTYLDELPQLVNVLRGEMSLVGPRPCLPYEAAEYARWHTRPFDLLPGLTGLWQVSGKNECTFREMIRLDIAYARRLSLWLDLKILFRTPLTVLSSLSGARGARSQAEAMKGMIHEQSA